MLKHLIKREILDNLLSLRLSLTLILMVVIMSASALLFISDHNDARATYAVNLKESRKQMEQSFDFWSVMSFDPHWVYKRPSDFAFLADGRDKDLPNAFRVSPFEIGGPNARLRTNPLLQPFESVDWLLAIGVIMSFAAIVLTFDAVSGDRERGTLKLSMSNPVPRATILLGKYIGALFSLLIPLLAGVLLNIIIIAVSGIVPMDASAWARIGMVSLFSLLYVAGFTSIGIFISSITRESATSLIVLLLSWAMLVIVIPGVGGIIASRIITVPSPMEAEMNAWAASDRAKGEYLTRHPEMRPIAFRSGWWSPGENLAGPLAAFEARNDYLNQYRDAMVRRIRAGQNVTRVSPLCLYKHAAEAIAGTGISHYDSFMKQVRQHREVLKGVLMDEYPLDPHKNYQDVREAMNKAGFKFELDDIPEFHEKPVAVEEAVRSIVWDILFLFLFSFLFFMGSVVAFLRYDVR